MKWKINSKQIKAGDTFVAIKGKNFDGHNFIDEAIKNGATEIVAEHGLYEVDTLIVSDTHEYLCRVLKETYREKLKDLKLIGMTGTNGKTTTCFLIQEGLNKLGKKCGYIGTIGFYIGEKKRDLVNTTPDILELYELLLECVHNKCEYVVMEASSQALSMHRLDGLEFDYAIFSNLTKDHLDYHKDMKSYALAKQKLFTMLKENGKAIINDDDDYKNYFLLDNNNITYGFNGGDYKITEYDITDTKSEFKVETIDHVYTYESHLLGHHNIYNLLVFIIVLSDLGISVDKIQTLTKEISSPAGRMDTIIRGDNRIIIDYAHTPDAVKNIIETVKKICKGRIITIVGCGGNRDKTKRPEMAKIATSLSDYAIFTSDNPRTEDPKKILNDMIQGLDNFNYEIIENRRYAIHKGIQILEKSDILLVLGKGHENYQVIGKEKIDFDDKRVVLEYIQE